MKRVNYHLTEQQIKALKRESKATGLKVADIIRRAIDEHFRQQEYVSYIASRSLYNKDVQDRTQQIIKYEEKRKSEKDST